MKDWCVRVIFEYPTGECPPYVLDLMDFDGPLAKLTRVIGFTPAWSPSAGEELALLGLAIKRGRTPYDMPVTEPEALAALDMNPEIVNLFKINFPDI